MKKNTAELGDEVKCKISGFKGIVTSVAVCLTGCDRATVQPPVNKDGKYPDALWVDIAALKVIKKGVVKKADVQNKKDPGGWPTKGMP